MYQLAITNNLTTQAQNLKENLHFDFEKFQHPRNAFQTTQQLAREAINHFLLYEAELHYYNDSSDTCLNLLSSVDSISLSAEERKLIKRLAFRSRLPKWLIHLFRR